MIMVRKSLTSLALLLAMVFLTACGGQGEKQDQSRFTNDPIEGASFAIENVRIFDGREVLEGKTIIVTDGRIATISDAPAPEDYQIIDGTDKTLLPGLIDAHVHAFDLNALRDALRFGVTTELDMFTAASFAADRKLVRDSYDQTDMADLYSAFTLVTSKGGHGTQFGLPIATIDDPALAGEFVRERLAEGADYIKIVYEPGNPTVTSISKEILEAVIAAAHDQGAMAIVHISKLEAARDAVNGGADGLVHIFADTAIDDELLASMKERNVFVIPTLSIIASAADRGLGAELLQDENLQPYLSGMQLDGLAVSMSGGRDLSQWFDLDIAVENVRRLHEAGIPILAGTDAPNPGTAYGVSMYGELELLVKAGLSPSEALKAATAASAESFGLTGRGVIAVGARTDLLLVDGDPTTDILAARSIDRIFKNGFEVTRERQDSKKITAQKPVLTDGFISRFEDDLSSGFAVGELAVDWIRTTDQLANGKSTAELSIVKSGAQESAGAMRIDGEISTKFFFPWSGAGVFFSEDFTVPFDLSDYQTISFYARGDERELSVLLFTRTSRQRPASRTININSDWQLYEIELSSIRGAALDEVFGLAITAGRPKGEFYFEIDDVRLQ
jgi:imidazolonepropionase-like amidohydrolase